VAAGAKAPWFAGRDEGAEEENEPDVGQRRVRDEVVAIEERGPAKPEKQAGGAAKEAGGEGETEREERGDENERERRRAPQDERNWGRGRGAG